MPFESPSSIDASEQTLLRKSLAALDVKRKSMGHEADAIFLELTTPPAEGVEPMGVEAPLVDPDGYPRGDIDVYRARALRQRFRVLQTDDKEMHQQIEGTLIQLAALNNADKKKEVQEEQRARIAPKPKPKYDPVTGKWVVMNWDGTVAGIPGGDKRNFAELNQQVSALTGDETTSEQSGSVVNSTCSATMTDRATYHPRDTSPTTTTTNGGQQQHHAPSQPFSRVDAVSAESPADRAGLKEEDLIVLFGPLDQNNHNHLRAIAELVPETAAAQQSLTIRLLRRKPGAAVPVGATSYTDDASWEHVTLQLAPRPWNGRGLLGCHIVPLQS